MIPINDHYQKLQASYLFSDIARRVEAFQRSHPEQSLIKLGIGDVTEPLPPACITAFHRAIDEMADRGETLEMVAKRALERGADSVVTASLFAHTWADPMPEEVARVSDALVIFPWDARVLVDGAWQLHPELAQAIALQAAADEAAPDAAESAPIDDDASGAET